MPETKLEKINDRLYHETSGKSKIKWEKSPELLDITLTDVKVGLCLSINKPSKTSISNEILSKCLPELIVRIELDVFLSEEDRTLSHPNIRDYYYIDEETTANRTRIIDVCASRPLE